MKDFEYEDRILVGRDTVISKVDVFKKRFPDGKGVVFDQSSDNLLVQTLLNDVTISFM